MGTWDPIWPLFLGHTPLTGKKREKQAYTGFYVFFSTTCRNNMGFIRVIDANDRKNHGHTGKYGKLREFDGEKTNAIRGARKAISYRPWPLEWLSLGL